MAAKKTKAKEPVKLREKKLANGNVSLYLDIYWNGKRKYEFLKLYLITPKTPADKEQNRQTLQLAQSIKAKKQLELQSNTHGFTSDFRLDTNFIDYFQSLTDDRKESQGNWGNWDSALKHLRKYCPSDTTFRDIDAHFVEGFKTYLAKEAKTKSGKLLSKNSQSSYFLKLKASLNKAFQDRYIPFNPGISVKPPKPENPPREFLTIDELKRLAKADCIYPVLKRAFLFSCLTGLRWSDVQKLTWSEVQRYNDSYRIVFRQKKTRGLEYLDITEQSRELLGEEGDREERVFVSLKYSAYHNLEIKRWCMRAGIMKEITFHCSRHTFAVMLLEQGTDIFTVSKLLGHSELRTTQIYAKVLDSKKRDAINKFPDIF